MLTKRLYSIILMTVLLIPFTIQAETITAPVYKIDVTQPAVGIGLDKPVAMAAVESASTVRSLSHANVKMTPRKQTTILISQCVSCHSTATGVIGVSGGDSVGGRRHS